jgi:hypothetical protein
MTDLRSTLERYVNMRQGLGYKYQEQARRLRDFISFMETRKAATITTKLALAWATLHRRSHVSSARRLTDVRGFARHVASIDPKTQVPPTGIFPQWRRPKPYVYSDGEIDALLRAALALPPTDGLRRWTYHHLFGLIAVTGMRLSEAIGLQRVRKACSRFDRPSLASHASYPCIGRPVQRCAAMPSGAMLILDRIAARISSSRSEVVDWRHNTFTAFSGACPARSVCGVLAILPDRACTTSGIGSPSARSSVGIATR